MSPSSDCKRHPKLLKQGLQGPLALRAVHAASTMAQTASAPSCHQHHNLLPRHGKDARGLPRAAKKERPTQSTHPIRNLLGCSNPSPKNTLKQYTV
jgi:hypothetical protein